MPRLVQPLGIWRPTWKTNAEGNRKNNIKTHKAHKP